MAHASRRTFTRHADSPAVAACSSTARLALPWLTVLLLIASATGCVSRPPNAAKLVAAYSGLSYSEELRRDPQPARVIHLTVDLHDPAWVFDTAYGPDPDDAGPVEADRMPPAALMQASPLAIGLTANSSVDLFDPLDPATVAAAARRATADPALTQSPGFDVNGLLASGGVMRSRPEFIFPPIWLDREGALHIGAPGDADLPRIIAAAAGRQWFIQSGEIILGESNWYRLSRPVAAVGVDETGRWLHLVVVDARGADVRNGMNLEELGLYMQGVGCYNAISFGDVEHALYLRDPRTGDVVQLNTPLSRFYGLKTGLAVPALLGLRRQPVTASP